MDKRALEILRKATAPKKIRLGQPPWSKEELTQAYFRNAAQTMLRVTSRPGAKYSNAIDALDLSVALFNNAVESLFDSIETYRQKSIEPKFGSRIRRSEEEHYQLTVRRNLFSVVAAALALVEHSRVVQKKLMIPDYQEHVDQEFKNHVDHRLIQELRDYVLHSRLLPADWQTTIKYGEGKETRFYIRKTVLLSSKKWSRSVSEYIRSLDYGVDIEELFLAYRSRVLAFHTWYRGAIEIAGDWVLREYREYQRVIKGIGWRTSYQILIQTARGAKIDPFKRLNEYLFPHEIEYVFSTQDLKEQVDRIIEILDEYNACDDSLRSEVYKLFGVAVEQDDVGG
ncbi:MAG: hypothetical protein M0P73_01500 [Syntrophobacterales bacterium]|jgi:hypothetical protein|nr:hypothetical protein [Syntrophobacterales bacterium]